MSKISREEMNTIMWQKLPKKEEKDEGGVLSDLANMTRGDETGLSFIITVPYLIIVGVVGAVEATSAAIKTTSNVRAINSGKVEVIGTNVDGKICAIKKQRSNTNITKTTITDEKQISPRPSKIKKGLKILSDAYKLTKSKKTEIINNDDDDSNEHTERGIINLVADNFHFGDIYQEIIKTTALTFRFNNQWLFNINEFRSIIFPDSVAGEKLELEYPLYYPNDTELQSLVSFKLSYVQGKLMKLSLPNKPKVFKVDWAPMLTVYHDKLYSLPISSGHYKYLQAKITENGGTVEIAEANPNYKYDTTFSIELIGES
ncbi:MAG: hypothetical protein RLZZ81_366 [Pseudomonadota bacterium]|jgi:hypothetical protein